jgi:glycosyltransferase involved in cell wall biosynthesis
MQPKHILHITFNMQIGGTEQVIRNLVEGLDPAQYTSSILCIDGEIGPWGKELQAKGFKHFCWKRKPGLDTGLIRKIGQLIRSEGVDILHCHQYTPYSYGCLGSLLNRVPVIFTEHGRFYPDFGTTKRRCINPLLQLKTAAITAISAATKTALVEHENFSEHRIEVIYNGIADLANGLQDDDKQALQHSLGLNPSDIVYGTISRLDTIKNQTMMIKAFAQAMAAQPALKLLIVGDGPERDTLQQLTAELRLNDAVIFTGFQANPQAYLSLMDVFLLPSLSEGTSMTLLEAMSFSKPSIATAVGGTPEILQHEKTGLLTDNKDQQGLCDAITTLAGDAALRSTYGNNARHSYEKRFTLSAMSQAYEALYQRICPHPSPCR